MNRAPLLSASVLLALLFGCSGTAAVSDSGPPPARDGGTPPIPVEDDAGFARRATSVETTASSAVRVGQPIMVTCTLRTEEGEMILPPAGYTPTYRFSPENSVMESGGTFTATRAGEIEVTCEFAQLMLIDPTPARVIVLEGAPAVIVTTLDATTITAGGTVNATCAVFDSFGNRVPDTMPTLQVSPQGDGNTQAALAATFTRAGIYTVACQLDGAMGPGVRVEVRPALPANLAIARVPEQPVYAIGQIIQIDHIVTDRYGNPVEDAVVSTTSNPPGMGVGDARFRYAADGTYNITARVQPPTEGDVELVQRTTIRVNSTGATINCVSPGDATMLNATPGGTVTFRGSAADENDVAGMPTTIQRVTVNGAAVTLSPDGTFQVPLTTRFGINFVDITATDRDNIENSRTCAFLVSNRYQSETQLLADAVSLKLGMSAIDDGAPISPITSLDDVLETVVNSPGLRNTLDTALRGANPIKPSSCDASVFGACIFRSQVDYEDLQLSGPNITSLALVNGGIRATVRFNNVSVRLRISGTLGTSGWVDFQYIEVGLIFDLAIAGGRPTANVRAGTITSSVGNINTRFSGLSGVIVNIVASIAEGTLKNAVEGLLRDYVSSNFDAVLDGLVGGLDISSLGSTFNVPRLDGSGNIPLSFGLGFSSLNITTARALFGIGTRFSAPTTRATPSLGIPLPPNGTVLSDPAITQPAAVGVYLGVFNQVLHTLWRAGFLDARLNGGTGGALPQGAYADLRTNLPPVASITQGGLVNLDLGGIDLELLYPPVITTPLRVQLGARASTSVMLVGNDLRFGNLTVTELHASTGDVTLDMATRTALEGFLRQIVQQLVDSSLNNALPALPIPSFTLPASLATYGLPAGRKLGLTNPVLAVENPHFVLRGGFGVQ